MKFTLILFDLIFIGKKQKGTKEVNFQAILSFRSGLDHVTNQSGENKKK